MNPNNVRNYTKKIMLSKHKLNKDTNKYAKVDLGKDTRNYRKLRLLRLGEIILPREENSKGC
jgi:hypothetical protein